MKYLTVYTIAGNKIQKGEISKITIKVGNNIYDVVEQESPNITFFFTEEEAKKELAEQLQTKMSELSQALEDL